MITDRQQRTHWFFSRLADVLLIVLLAAFVAYSLYAWGPM